MSQAATTAPAPKTAPVAESLSGIEQSGAPLPVILVTGLSGAGHSTALRALEDGL
jgi:adenylylsulfate kinase-like enzyme